jgi:translocation and assembly module TamA
LLVRITSRISIFLVTSLLALSLHAQVDIELTGVSGEIEDNLLAHFSTLEAPTNPLQQEAFYEKVISSVDEAVQVFGYYNASVEVTPKDQDDDLSWIVDITLGTASKITKLELGLLGNGQQDAILQKIVAESKLKLNEAIFHPDYEATKNRLRSTALARGYFDFKFSKNAIIVDQENNQVEVNLVADTGSRYSFGEVIISKDHPADFLIRSLIPFKQGQPYLANSLSNLTQLLKRTGYFKYVVVRPLLSDASENQVPIEVIVLGSHQIKVLDLFLNGNVPGSISMVIQYALTYLFLNPSKKPLSLIKCPWKMRLRTTPVYKWGGKVLMTMIPTAISSL